ncbi:UDP-N-acetylmuramoyl-L-alanine--D-glutamate ligase [Candidatus Saccharibacteria bacterium]|nr:UDP-N-acetylmuramoyl-L-alanine--D-glutamate ligase [Candidatus Saccharibacteria bacterium]
MKIALLGYGKEGQAAEKYFKAKFPGSTFDIFDNFTYDEIKQRDYSLYDIVLRSPSVPPLGVKNESSLTKYFFNHCPCPIIGVTATKGKGTTCSFIKSILDALGKNAYLVGNIGTPAIEVLDQLSPTSIVVYEMSSFQLWDLHKSPHIAVIGHLEPDHLNVHKDYADYLAAKANITSHQSPSDYLIYNSTNPETVKIANTSKARKVPYPYQVPADILAAVQLPGQHNQQNALAAIAAVASYYNISPDEFIREKKSQIIAGLKHFHGLPHRLEFLREFNNVKYYDDNFSTNPSSTRVAVNSFPNSNIVVIIGGRDKTHYEDLPEIYEILQAPQIKHIVLIGESGHELANRYADDRFTTAGSLDQAVAAAREFAEAITPAVVVMSPAAASFDMFDNVYDRGNQYQNIIKNLS